MMKMARSIGLTLLLAAGSAMAQHTASHGTAIDAKVTPLLTREMKDIPGKEVLMITVDYPPGAADPVHRHDAHSFVYVLEGSIVMGVKGGKEVLMITVDYPPGAADPVHRHDAHSFVYVLEGSIVMGVKGGKEVTLKAGDTFYEGPDDIHTVGRNASKTKPAKFVVMLVKNKGAEFFIPVK
jgi:quercetin dioxygenase-like cupin family protein